MKKKRIVDVVNLNADASCLSSAKWLNMLNGGVESYFFQWLSVYVKTNKKIALGITGATAADIAIHNPESIQLINNNPNVFEIILRPFSHDIALLRSALGFEYNLEFGKKTLSKLFKHYTNYFLPPEFMLTNEQILILTGQKVEGTFINPARFKDDIVKRLPKKAYVVRGLLNSSLNCIIFNGKLTHAFLNGIHHFNARQWNQAILETKDQTSFCWRDGESSFFVPDGNVRELKWLNAEDKKIERCFLRDTAPDLNFEVNDQLIESNYHYYPIHSFTAWMKEFRMMGYLKKIDQIETGFNKLSQDHKFIWLQAINSDILSAIEKDSPVIRIKVGQSKAATMQHTIWRSERGIEGEYYLQLLENNKAAMAYRKVGTDAASIKLNGRVRFLKQLSK
ncbi:MAG: hypothetical protein RIQ89_1432 [Bacteroidota bacterium]|jgi:hypothetical protein